MSTRQYRYPWPASGISKADMSLLHTVREGTRSDKPVPITVLVSRAIQIAYGTKASPTPADTEAPAAKAA